jgi:MFS transporter, FHS family, glucose/mannose:H+ symporter
VRGHHAAFAAACQGMLLFGLTLTTLGSVLPPLIDRYGLDKADAGSLMALMSLGILAGSLVFGPVVDRYGYRPVLTSGAVGVGAGLATIAGAPTARVLAPAMLVFGFAGGLLNGSTNALVADITPEGRGSGLALLGVFFGIGAFGMPLLLGILLKWLTYRAVVGGLAALVMVSLADFALVRLPPPKQAQGFPLRRIGALLGDTVLVLVGLMLFLQSGMEITLGGWSAQYVREVLHLSERRSILLLSLFWVGMVAARLALSGMLASRPPRLVLPGFLAVAAAAAVLLLVVPTAAAAALGLFWLGAGLSAGFPILLGILGGRYEDLTGTAFSAVFVMALIGGSALPFVTGVLGDRIGLRASLIVVPLCILGQGLLFVPLVRRLGASAKGVGQSEEFPKVRH